MMKESIDMPRSKFLKVVCRKCKNEQVVFSRATTLIKCSKCGADLVLPTGGEAEILGKALPMS